MNQSRRLWMWGGIHILGQYIPTYSNWPLLTWDVVAALILEAKSASIHDRQRYHAGITEQREGVDNDEQWRRTGLKTRRLTWVGTTCREEDNLLFFTTGHNSTEDLRRRKDGYGRWVGISYQLKGRQQTRWWLLGCGYDHGEFSSIRLCDEWYLTFPRRRPGISDGPWQRGKLTNQVWHVRASFTLSPPWIQDISLRMILTTTMWCDTSLGQHHRATGRGVASSGLEGDEHSWKTDDEHEMGKLTKSPLHSLDRGGKCRSTRALVKKAREMWQ